MKKSVTISRQTVEAALRHIRDGVALEDLGVTQDTQNRIERVAHVLRWCQMNPQQDPRVIFRALAAGRYNNACVEWHVAAKDQALYRRLTKNN